MPLFATYAHIDTVYQVNALNEDDYNAGIATAVVASLVCGSLACLASVFLALLLHPDFTTFVLRLSHGMLHCAVYAGTESYCGANSQDKPKPRRQCIKHA